MNTLQFDRRRPRAPLLLAALFAALACLPAMHHARAADAALQPSDATPSASGSTAVPSSAPPAIALPPPAVVPPTPALSGSAPPAPSTPGPSAAPVAPAPATAPPAAAPSALAPPAAAPAPPVPAVAGAPTASAEAAPAGTRSLDEQVQDLKKSTLQLNRDLFILEEELLFPANTQVAVFVSVDVGDFFALDSISLKIDNREVSNYLYTPREVSALLKGGVQRLYVGNLKSGEHEMVAFFSGKGPNERYYRRAASIRFEKGVGAKYLELKVTDRARAQQPEFDIKDWQ